MSSFKLVSLYHLFLQIIQHYGLGKNDFTHVLLSPECIIKKLQEGEVDAVCFTFALRNNAITNLLITSQPKMMGLDQIAGMKIALPYLEETKLPRGTYSGMPTIPHQDITTASVRTILLSHEDVDEEIIYEVVRILREHQADLVTEYPYAANIKSPEPEEYFTVPLHSGAQNYYSKNKPGFIVKYAEVITLVISIIALLFSGLIRVSLAIKEKQKDRADRHNLDILGLVEQIYSTHDSRELEVILQRLLKIFREVIVDLDEDRISLDYFQSFTFSWEVAMATLHHRETILIRNSSSTA